MKSISKSRDFDQLGLFMKRLVVIRLFLFHNINSQTKLFMDELISSETELVNVERIVVGENRGVQQHLSPSIVIGYVSVGEKRLHHINGIISCREGELFILGPGIYYEENRVGKDGVYKQFAFRFDLVTLQRLLCALNVNYGISLSSKHLCLMCGGYNVLSDRASDLLRDFFAVADTSIYHAKLLNDEIGVRIKLNELIYLLLSGEDNCFRHRLLRLADNDVMRFVRVVYNNLFSDVSIESLAALTHNSLTSFKSRFRHIFGMPPHRWIVEQRLLRARVLLQSSQMTISEIANGCGFTNVSHFIKLFKRRFGATPRAYRRE